MVLGDGTPDPTFGGGGFVVIDAPGFNAPRANTDRLVTMADYRIAQANVGKRI